MSVATEFAPTVTIPARARAATLVPVPPLGLPPLEALPLDWPTPSRQPADVAVLRPPVVEPAPLRLTRRGVVVLALAVALVGVALVWFARASAPTPSAPRVSPSVVTVQPGDTLWAIASRVAPNADPQAEVDRLVRLNHLGGVDLVPGQQLHVG